MTILEAKYKFGVRTTKTIRGDTLNILVNRLYSSDAAIYYNVLKTLNLRYDWFDIEPGSEIIYLSKDVTKKIDEV